MLRKLFFYRVCNLLFLYNTIKISILYYVEYHQFYVSTSTFTTDAIKEILFATLSTTIISCCRLNKLATPIYRGRPGLTLIAWSKIGLKSSTKYLWFLFVFYSYDSYRTIILICQFISIVYSRYSNIPLK